MFSKAEIVARKVLDECGLNDPTEFPIKEIIFGRGAFYQEKPLIGKEGRIVSFNGKSIITVNSNIEFEPKKRFVAAHELGHYEMHRELIPVINDTEYDLINWYKVGEQESEANEFAAEFLMPAEIFQKECFRKKFNPTVIDFLAKRFVTSKTSTILRFVRKGNHPVGIMYCKDNKMKWWKKSDDFPYFFNFTYNAPPPTDSVAYEVFTSPNNKINDNAQQIIWKSTWFNLGKYDDDTKFYEYCLYVPSFQYSISIIWED
ncbi:MAG: ImmA/IrrE family metallo-endopeptidase [Bacteroidia bacterium]